MKNYSFSNIAAQDSYLNRKANDISACYRHSELKAAQANQRIEEIKKKYDTPSRRERIQSLKKSRDFCAGTKLHSKEDTKQNQPSPKEDYLQSKENFSHHRLAPSFGNNPLKQSFAVNRLEKSALKNDINSKQLDCIRGNENDYHRRSQDEKQTNIYSLKSRSREDEEVLFSKVREMKESIINNDYMRGSNGRASISSAKYSQLTDSKTDPSRKFDPRVENIDKINAKIKQILSCLAQNEKKQPKFQRDSPSNILPKDSIPSRNSIIPSTNVDNTRSSYLRNDRSFSKYENTKESGMFGSKTRQLQETNLAYKNRFSNSIDNLMPKENFIQTKQIQIPQTSNYIPTTFKSQDQKRISSFKHEPQQINTSNRFTSENQRPKIKQYRDYSASKADSYLLAQGVTSKKQQQLIKTPTYINSRHLQNKTGIRTSQSRSQIDSIKKSVLNDTQKSDVLKSGKKLNDQISKIQKKIEQFQAQKKKLNIQFTPFSMKNRSSSNLAAGARFVPSAEVVKKPDEQVISSAPYFRNSISTYQIKLKNPTSTGFNDKKTSKEQQQQSQQTTKSIDFLNLSIIEQRKRRKSTEQIIMKSAYLKKFVQLFRSQVSLDVAFRDMKMWVKSKLCPSTYQNISQLLKKEGLNYTQKQLESILRINQSQFDPLYDDQKKGNLQTVVTSYLQAHNHWTSQIKEQFKKEDLASRQFKQYMGFLDKKFIELPEFAQILSQSQITCYKTRDVDAIFKRLSNGDKLQLESILEQLCSL